MIRLLAALLLATAPAYAGTLTGDGLYPVNYDVCQSQPDGCTPATPVKISSEKWLGWLIYINRKVNTGIIPMKSLNWTPHQAVGDCKNFTATKRAMLLDLGVPAGAMRVGIGWVDELHAALVISTDAGDLVMDNLSTYVVPVEEAKIDWWAIQDVREPTKWLRTD